MLRLSPLRRALRPLCRGRSTLSDATRLRLLVVEAYDKAGRERLASVG